MRWKYEQASGKMFRPDGSLAAVGYSGRGIGRNCPAYEQMVCVGPIPRGVYEAGGPHEGEHTGHYTLNLTPDVETRARIIALGRGPDSFKAHGDNRDHTASEGCIVLPFTIRTQLDKREIEVV